MANIATTPEDPQHFHVFKTEKREKKLQNQSRFELWRGTGHLKHHELPNFCPKNLNELSHHAIHALRRLRRRPTLVTAFWKQSGLFEEC
jgi:hypothetical protein